MRFPLPKNDYIAYIGSLALSAQLASLASSRDTFMYNIRKCILLFLPLTLNLKWKIHLPSWFTGAVLPIDAPLMMCKAAGCDLRLPLKLSCCQLCRRTWMAQRTRMAVCASLSLKCSGDVGLKDKDLKSKTHSTHQRTGAGREGHTFVWIKEHIKLNVFWWFIKRRHSYHNLSCERERWRMRWRREPLGIIAH